VLSREPGPEQVLPSKAPRGAAIAWLRRFGGFSGTLNKPVDAIDKAAIGLSAGGHSDL
jgi:hypothetical protein